MVCATSVWPASQGEWTGMHVCERWRLHCTRQWGRQTPLSGHVYCAAIAFKMTQWAEQRICIKFCVRLEHSSTEDWGDSEGCSYGQLGIGSFSTTTHLLVHHVLCSFLVKHQITQVTKPPYSPDLAPWDSWLFPKLKSPLKGKRLQNFSEIQENTTGQLMVIARQVWGPKVPTLKGTEASLSYVRC